MNKIDAYVDEVLKFIVADESMKERIRSDLTLQLNEAGQAENIDHVMEGMGDPREVAKEFMDSIYEDKSDIIEKLIREHNKVKNLMNDIYEYKSKISLFGLPLVHVKINRRNGKPAVAKGIIAIGTISIGVISIGAIPFGLISIGGAAVGLISAGGLAIGLLLAVGGMSVGALAFGGLAVGLGAIGGCAVGEIAIGGFARGTVAIGTNTVGAHTLTTNHIGPENREAVHHLIKTAFPGLSERLVNFFSSLNIDMSNSRVE